MTSETMDDLVPLSDDDAQSGGFRHVLRGYDPKQVEDYLDRVEVALNEGDERHAEDLRRIAALEQQVGELTGRLTEAERRAAGRPQTASALGERMAAMLKLAEEEAAAIRGSAQQEAQSVVQTAKQQAEAESVERTRDLEKREREVQTAQREAESARLDAQKDAEALRTRPPARPSASWPRPRPAPTRCGSTPSVRRRSRSTPRTRTSGCCTSRPSARRRP
jgi:DivIVA domain-containing protein